MYADLGYLNHHVKQGSASGMNGVLRWNYGSPDIGTCRESISGGNHIRWLRQRIGTTTSIFLTVSYEQSLANLHNLQRDGYNRGRDDVVRIATQENGIEWEGNVLSLIHI